MDLISDKYRKSAAKMTASQQNGHDFDNEMKRNKESEVERVRLAAVTIDDD